MHHVHDHTSTPMNIFSTFYYIQLLSLVLQIFTESTPDQHLFERAFYKIIYHLILLCLCD